MQFPSRRNRKEQEKAPTFWPMSRRNNGYVWPFTLCSCLSVMNHPYQNEQQKSNGRSGIHEEQTYSDGVGTFVCALKGKLSPSACWFATCHGTQFWVIACSVCVCRHHRGAGLLLYVCKNIHKHAKNDPCWNQKRFAPAPEFCPQRGNSNEWSWFRVVFVLWKQVEMLGNWSFFN